MEYKIRYRIINQIGYMCRYDLSLSQAKKQFNELKNNPNIEYAYLINCDSWDEENDCEVIVDRYELNYNTLKARKMINDILER